MKKIILLAVFASLIFAGCTQTTTTNELDDFAKCLTDKGVTMYGAPTCPYCQKQKEMFGDSFQHIDYVDCTQSPERCGELGGVPARQFDEDTIIEGLQNLTTLAANTSCELPEEK